MTTPMTATSYDAEGRPTGSTSCDGVLHKTFDGVGALLAQRDATPDETAAVTQSGRQSNGAALRQALRAALANNRAFLATPGLLTLTQVTQQLRALTRQVQQLIRLAADDLDGTD